MLTSQWCIKCTLTLHTPLAGIKSYCIELKHNVAKLSPSFCFIILVLMEVLNPGSVHDWSHLGSSSTMCVFGLSGGCAVFLLYTGNWGPPPIAMQILSPSCTNLTTAVQLVIAMWVLNENNEVICLNSKCIEDRINCHKTVPSKVCTVYMWMY